MYNLQAPGFPSVGFPVNNYADPSLAIRTATGAPTLRRRPRTIYTPDQVDTLDVVFQRTHFPDFNERRQLAEQFGLDEKRIQTWFKNRRSRFRKQMMGDQMKVEMKFEKDVPTAGFLGFAAAPNGGIFQLADGQPHFGGGQTPAFGGGGAPPGESLAKFQEIVAKNVTSYADATSALRLSSGGFPPSGCDLPFIHSAGGPQMLPSHLFSYIQYQQKQGNSFQQPQLGQPQLRQPNEEKKEEENKQSQ